MPAQGATAHASHKSRPVAALRSVANPLQVATNTIGNRVRHAGGDDAEAKRAADAKRSAGVARPAVVNANGTPGVATGSRHSQRGAARAAVQQQPRAAPPVHTRPPTRLEREKKRHFNDPANVGPWKLGKLIGQGASGRVRLAVHSHSQMPAAVKIVPKQMLLNSRMSLRDLTAKQDLSLIHI